jgi:hypothetical protein
VSVTTLLELAVLAVGLIALVGTLAWLALLVEDSQHQWERVIAEHVEATGDYPTVGEWRSGRVGRDATRPPEPEPGPWCQATVTVTCVDGRPVAGSAR